MTSEGSFEDVPLAHRHGGVGGARIKASYRSAMLRIVLKAKDGAGGDYWWVTCSGCDCSWQVPYYAASVE
jgi:hypothetical protein